jgi:hypothetical protein
MPLTQVAFDIETTGFEATDTVTVLGFAVPMGVRVFVRADEQAADPLEAAIDTPPGTVVDVSTHATERAVLEAVGDFVDARLRDEDVLLVAYNGERWDGGFDLPFLRTRYATHDRPWPFVDVPYADLLPLVGKRFNTTQAGAPQDDLVAAYELLCDGTYGDLDPFTDSSEAVTAYEGGEFAAVVQHNVADVLRTRALGALAERYCSKAEFDVKSLSPTRSG